MSATTSEIYQAVYRLSGAKNASYRKQTVCAFTVQLCFAGVFGDGNLNLYFFVQYTVVLTNAAINHTLSIQHYDC